MYSIVRFYFSNNKKCVLKKGLSLQEAQEHCRNPETSYKTCKSSKATKRTQKFGPWFDGYVLSKT